MRTPKRLSYAICVASVAALTSPSAAFSYDYNYQDQSYGKIARPQYAQNFAPSEFFSQAERDLVARVRDNLVADPVLAPVSKDVAIEANVGTITLRGSIPTQADKERLTKTVGQVLGVEHVKDEVRVTNTASMTPSSARLHETTKPAAVASTETTAAPRGAFIAPPVSSFPATGGRGLRALDDQAQPGSGRMAEEDRTGTTGPSGTRSSSAFSTGAVDTIGRVAKSAGDYAVTEVDRGLASQIRLSLTGRPGLSVTEDNLHLVVDNGFVTLQGWVPSEQERLTIADAVRNISGVQGVNNRLRVRPNAVSG